MKFSRIFCFIVSALMLFGMSSCASQYDEIIGTYTCARIALDEEEFHVLDVYPKGCTLQLSKWGQAWLNIQDDSFYGRWELEAENFVLDINGAISSGTLKDGVCLLRLGENGMEHSFLKEGASLPQKPTLVQQQPLTQQQIFWNGDWYGYWTIKNAQGKWQDQSGQSFDCFARFDIDAEGNGTMTFWDEMQDYFNPIAVAEVFISRTGDRQNAGVLTTTGGSFLDSALEAEQWTVDPAAYPVDSVFYIENATYAGEDGSFDYTMVLRPWGRTWEDVEASAPDMLPYFYHDWYIPAIASGFTMPDSFEYTGKAIIRDTWTDPQQQG